MAEVKNYIPALRYDWLTKVYDPVLQLTMPEKKFKTALINQMSVQPGDRVLDFGCGSLTLSLMAAKSQPMGEFHGVDIDDKILAIARQKAAREKIFIQTQQYDGIKLPYPDCHFHRVMSSLVFHHLTLLQKYAALVEIYRVLKPSGSIHIADFGKPANLFQRIGFYGVQCLDGFETTGDSVSNVLPIALSQLGFLMVAERDYFKTMVGTVRLVMGVKKT